MPLLENLGGTVEEIRDLVPVCVGLSVVRTDHEGSCTLAVSDEVVAVIEALQYLDGGPGVDAAAQGRRNETRLCALNGRWPLFVSMCHRSGVRSMLTLPITEKGLVLGAVHVYAGLDGACTGLTDDLERLVGGVARDLLGRGAGCLASRRLAERAPVSLRGQGAVNRAIGALTVHLDTDVTEAHEHLDDAAVRAGISADQLALTLVDLHD